MKVNFSTLTIWNMSNKSMLDNDHLFKRIHEILENARHKVYRTANTEMLRAYWNVGREIIVEEQRGQDWVKYGRGLIRDLSIRLTKEYGRGFTETNLKYMRQFYLTFQKRHALRDELSWTHYRLLLKVEREGCKGLLYEGGNYRKLEHTTVGKANQLVILLQVTY
jgi:hypothetical protein